MNHYKFVLEAGAIKNRDKLIDPTVRVKGQAFFICLGTRKLSRFASVLFLKLFFFCLVAVNCLVSARGRKILKSVFLGCKLFAKA
jgi:hypothetical protein